MNIWLNSVRGGRNAEHDNFTINAEKGSLCVVLEQKNNEIEQKPKWNGTGRNLNT